jgi:hypothetical protein
MLHPLILEYSCYVRSTVAPGLTVKAGFKNGEIANFSCSSQEPYI